MNAEPASDSPEDKAGSGADDCKKKQPKSLSPLDSPVSPRESSDGTSDPMGRSGYSARCSKTAPQTIVPGGPPALGDPMGFEQGARVTFHSLNATHMNGRAGSVLEFFQSQGDYLVKLDIPMEDGTDEVMIHRDGLMREAPPIFILRPFQKLDYLPVAPRSASPDPMDVDGGACLQPGQHHDDPDCYCDQCCETNRCSQESPVGGCSKCKGVGEKFTRNGVKYDCPSCTKRSGESECGNCKHYGKPCLNCEQLPAVPPSYKVNPDKQ